MTGTSSGIRARAALRAGTPPALASSAGGLLGWVMTDVQLVSARGLRGIEDAPVRFGVGPAAGLRARLSSNAVLLFAGEWIWLPMQPLLASYQVTGGARWRFSRSLALSATGA